MSFFDKTFYYAKLFLKGAFVSLGFMVPGMSGGTMALIVGIYHKLLASVSGFFKDIKQNILFLAVVGGGALVGIFLLSAIMTKLLAVFRVPVIYLFLGLIVGGLPLLFEQSRKRDQKNPLQLLYILIGAAAVVAVAAVSKFYMGSIDTDNQIVRWAVFVPAGVFVAIALILPGISTTAFLEALGIYEQSLVAIQTLDIMFLLPLLIGAALGIVFTTKMFETLLEKKTRQTYLLIIGFVIGSLGEIYPGLPQGMEILWSALLFAAGTALVLALTYFTKNSRETSTQTQTKEQSGVQSKERAKVQSKEQSWVQSKEQAKVQPKETSKKQ